MSDLVIRSSRVIEVDTVSLHAVAGSLHGVVGEAEDIVGALGRVIALLWDAGPAAFSGLLEIESARAVVVRAAEDAADVAEALERSAQLYETVELLAEREVAAAKGDSATVARLDRALSETSFWMRGAAHRALHAAVDRTALRGQVESGTWVLAPHLGGLSMLTVPLFGSVDALGRGRVGADERLVGRASPVEVRRVHTERIAPPVSLADAASRIPGGGESRVRVERYAMPSGPAQYAVYIAGTQSLAGRGEAFDMRSNLELYGGERSASYEAVVRALDQAGAGDGDVVHAFGHSQGAMLAERLALEGEYDTRTVVSFGSPVQADVGDQTLSVSLRHTDDPVATLQSGGHALPVGAPGGFVVERLADPLTGFRDLSVPAHHMASYVETAAMVDASDDPRVTNLREVFANLGRAGTGVREDFAAERVSPPASAAG